MKHCIIMTLLFIILFTVIHAGDYSSYFDGDDDKITLGSYPEIDPNKPCSISFWVYRLKPFASYVGYIGNYNTVDNIWWSIHDDDGTTVRSLKFQFRKNGLYHAWESTDAINNYVNNWVHVIITFNGDCSQDSSVCFYFNNVLSPVVQTLHQGAVDSSTSSVSVAIGQTVRTVCEMYFDELNIFTREISAVERYELFNKRVDYQMGRDHIASFKIIGNSSRLTNTIRDSTRTGSSAWIGALIENPTQNPANDRLPLSGDE